MTPDSGRHRRLAIATAAACALAAGGALSSADTVVLRNKPPFTNVTVVAYKQGIVHFRGISKQTLRKPIEEIQSLAIDAAVHLAEAENAAEDARWDDAEAAYRLAAEEAADDWLRELIETRMLLVLDRSGRFSKAVAAYVELVRRPGAAASVPRPRRPGQAGSLVNRAARATLETAIDAARTGEERRALRTLLLEVLIVEGVEPQSAGFRPPPRLPAPAPRAEAAPIPPAARRIRIPIRPTATSEPDRGSAAAANAGPISLPADSAVRHAVESLLERRDAAGAEQLVARAMPFAASADVGAWQLLGLRARLEAGDAQRAAADLTKLAEDAQPPPIRFEALYYAGVAQERLDRPDIARALYREVINSADASEAVRGLAEAALERLE